MSKLVNAQPTEFRSYGILLKLFTIAILLVPLIVVAALVGALKSPAFIWAFALWLVSLVLLLVRISYWPCPACGKAFCRKNDFDRAWIYEKQCVHCGLKRPRLGFFD